MSANLSTISTLAAKIEESASTVVTNADDPQVARYVKTVKKSAVEIQEVCDTLIEQERALKNPPSLNETTLPEHATELLDALEELYYGDKDLNPLGQEGPSVNGPLSDIEYRARQLRDELVQDDSVDDSRFSGYEVLQW